MAKGILRIKLLGDAAGLSKTLNDAQGSLGKFGSVAKTAALGVASAFAGASAAVGKFAFSSAVDIDDAMDTIRVGTGATGEALEGLGASFKTVFKGVPASAQDVGQAIADLNTRTGATGEALETLATKATLLSKITGEDLGGQIAATTRVFGDWGIAAKNQAGALDYLFKVSQSTGIGVTELSEKVVQFGAPLRQLGFDFETSAALMGKFEREGVNLETVMSGLRIGLANFAKAGEDPKEALIRLTDQIKNAGSQAEANSLAVKVFGQRAGADMAAAIREGRFEIDDLLSSLKASPETINAAAEATYDFGEKWAMVKNKLAVAIEPLGGFMMDALGRLADWVGQFMPQITGFFEMLVGKVRDSGLSLGQLGSALNLLNPIMGIFKELWPQLQPLIRAVADLLVEMAANVVPVLAQAWQTFMDVAAPILRAFLDVVMQVFPTIIETIRTVMNAVLPIVQGVLGAIQSFWSEHGQTIMAVVRQAFGVIQTVIQTVMGVIQGVIKTVTAIIRGDWSAAWQGIKQIFASIWQGMKDIWEQAAGWLRAIPQKILGFFAGAGRWLYDIGKAVIQGLWDGLRATFEKVGGWFKSIGGWFKSWKGPIEKDRKLLIPEGQAVMQSLATGLESGIPKVKRLLSGLTADLTVNPAAIAGGGTAGIGSSRDTALLERIARALEMGRGDIVIHATSAEGGAAAGDAFLRRMALGGVMV